MIGKRASIYILKMPRKKELFKENKSIFLKDKVQSTLFHHNGYIVCLCYDYTICWGVLLLKLSKFRLQFVLIAPFWLDTRIEQTNQDTMYYSGSWLVVINERAKIVSRNLEFENPSLKLQWILSNEAYRWYITFDYIKRLRIQNKRSRDI